MPQLLRPAVCARGCGGRDRPTGTNRNEPSSPAGSSLSPSSYMDAIPVYIVFVASLHSRTDKNFGSLSLFLDFVGTSLLSLWSPANFLYA